MTNPRRRFSAVAAAAAAALAATTCMSPLDGTQVAGGGVAGGSTGHACGRRCVAGSGSSGSGSSGGSTSGGSTTGAAGSSGGGSTGCGQVAGGGGSTLPFDCTNVSSYFHGDAGPCTGAPAWFGTVVTDFATCEPVCGAQMTLIDQNGIQIPGASTLSSGYEATAYLCLQSSGLIFSPSVSDTSQNYGTFYYGEMQGQVLIDVPAMGMLDSQEIQAYQQVLPQGLDSSKGQALFFIFGLDSRCGQNAQAVGWTVSLDFPDGGAYPDGSYTVVYPSATGFPDPNATSTSTLGVALVTNIDPSLGSFVRPVYGIPPNAAGCQLMNNLVGFTGRIYVAQQSFAEQGIFLQAMPDGGP